MSSIKAVLFDLSGVLYEGDTALPGAITAIERLSQTGIPIRFVTNTTRSTREDILHRLQKMGFSIHTDQLFTAPTAVHDYLSKSALSPYLVVHPALATEFADLAAGNLPAVVIGDAADAFTYDHLNTAFRLLMQGAPLLAMGKNRYFKESDGLSLDMGPFVVSLEFAAGVEAVIIGKPSREFFAAAVDSTGCQMSEVVMIGDDVMADVVGALDAGLQAVLVRTGKYRNGDEKQLQGRGHCVADISAAVTLIMEGLH